MNAQNENDEATVKWMVVCMVVRGWHTGHKAPEAAINHCFGNFDTEHDAILAGRQALKNDINIIGYSIIAV